MSFGDNVRPATEDPYGDPADQGASQDILPASQDPYGDPADQVPDAARQHLAATDPADTQAYVANQVQQMAPAQANGLVGTLLNAVQQQRSEERRVGKEW